MEPTTVALLIFLLTFLLIITELVHKTLAALLGAFLMIFYGIVNYAEIGNFIETRVLGVIFGMMIVVEVVKDSGLFQFFGIKAIKLARGNSKALFIILTFLTCILSALLSNQISILIMVALTFTLCRSLRINPMPFIISETIIVNIGGIMFLISSTPNILVGTAAGFTFSNFMGTTFPFGILLLFITVFMLLFIYRKEFKNSKKFDFDKLDEWSVVHDKKFFWNSLILLCTTIIFFMIHDKIGVSVDFVAISSAIIILLLSGADPDETLRNIQWGTIFFFVGLFTVVGGLEKTGFLESVAQSLIRIAGNNKIIAISLILWISGLASGIVDNIPITMTLIPIAKTMVQTFNMNILWWCIAIGAGLGGNLTPIGSPSTVIAMGIAKKEGNPISFDEFFKIGFIVTITQLLLSTLYLLLRYFMF